MGLTFVLVVELLVELVELLKELVVRLVARFSGTAVLLFSIVVVFSGI